MKQFAMVLTGTINIRAKVPFQDIVDVGIRKKQYLDSLETLFRTRVAKKIVFCENSNEPCPDYLYELARRYKIDFEWLSFPGDTDIVERYGKGAGETEILDYAMDHSLLLRECSYFIKLTGRIGVRNIKRVIRSMSEDAAWFLTYGDQRLEMVDSRLFGMKKTDYMNTFYNCFRYAEDLSTYTIERIYAKKIVQNGVQYRSFRVFPNFKGVSGGYGFEYKTTPWTELGISLKRRILTIAHPLLLEPVAIWQGDMELPEEIWNDAYSFLSGKKVFFCGAGRWGCRFYRLARGKCRIAGWSDQKHIGKKIYGKRIVSLDKLDSTKVDYVVINAIKEETVDEMKRLIEEKGIDGTKIIVSAEYMVSRGVERYTH